MKPRELIESTPTPEGKRMTLIRHDRDFYIEVEGEELMSTRAPGSERALAELAAAELTGVPRPRVLIGGLGLGFTLERALEILPHRASVVVAEYFQAIVDWNRRYSFSKPGILDDPRVTVAVADVVEQIRTTRKPYDAILLDVDNGPSAWCLDSNSRLYDAGGLARLQRALTPGGLLAIWSAGRAHGFAEHLQHCGFEARAETVRSRGRKGQRHTIFLARSAS